MSLSFQSRNGPVPWLQPYTDREIARLAAAGCKNLVIAPISFVSDHIETLQELDQEYRHLAETSGILSYLRVPSFNQDPQFVDLLSQIVSVALGDALRL